jgi:hypothetical protein
MKDEFCRLNPVILSVTGFAINVCLFFVHDYMIIYMIGGSGWQWMFWLILLLVNVCLGVLIGTLVKRLHNGANRLTDRLAQSAVLFLGQNQL